MKTRWLLGVLAASMVLAMVRNRMASAAVEPRIPMVHPRPGGVALEGTTSDAGFRQTNNTTIVGVASGVALPVSNPVCVSAPQSLSVVGTAAVAIPASPLGGRKVLRVCLSLENAGSPKLKCAIDSTPVMGFTGVDGGTPQGDVMGPGDCYAYPIDTSHTLKCVSDTPNVGVLTYEC